MFGMNIVHCNMKVYKDYAVYVLHTELLGLQYNNPWNFEIFLVVIGVSPILQDLKRVVCTASLLVSLTPVTWQKDRILSRVPEKTAFAAGLINKGVPTGRERTATYKSNVPP